MDRRKTRNYKLVLDPTLKPGSQKVYRFDGSLPGVILTNFQQYTLFIIARNGNNIHYTWSNGYKKKNDS